MQQSIVMNKGQRPLSTMRRLRYSWLRTTRFLSLDMWRLHPEELQGWRWIVVSMLKVLCLSVQRFLRDDLLTRASSLTYSTVLSVVPMLAIIIGIAKGFGLQRIVQSSLSEALPGQREQVDIIFTYVENYLEQVQGGVFIGVGLLILLYTVLMLIATIEDAFNFIWQAQHGRPWGRRLLDYLSLFLLLPIILVISSGTTFVMSLLSSRWLDDWVIIAPLLSHSLNLLPYLMSIGLFTGLYIFLPNVKVKIMPALIAGSIAGVAYQLFQSFYISGVLWVSSYNAVYGSFAAVMLLFIWMQISWIITLFGAQLSYSIQNLSNYFFEQSTEHVSRRYLDFVLLVIMSCIVQRFASIGVRPYSADELSSECHIPIRMVNKALALLCQIGVLTEIELSHGDGCSYYQPAIDPEILTIGYLLAQVDSYGREDFCIDHRDKYAPEWEAMLSSRRSTQELEQIPLKQLHSVFINNIVQ